MSYTLTSSDVNPGDDTLASDYNTLRADLLNHDHDGTNSPFINIGGTGADGALNVTSGTTALDAAGAAVLVKNYTSINVSLGATLTISNPHDNGTILVHLSQGNVTIDGTVDLDSMGAVGGSSDADDGNEATTYLFPVTGGEGASANRIGGVAGASTIFNKIVLGKDVKVQCGSGGGSSTDSVDSTRGDGGRGGGALYIECNGAWDFTGTITADGASGTDGGDNTGANSGTSGGGGGGAGGSVVAIYRTLTADSGTYSLDGGDGGDGGNGSAGTSGSDGYGGGGGGTNRLSGGDGGTTPSGNGQDGVAGANGTSDDGTGGTGGAGGTGSARSAGSGGGGGAGGKCNPPTGISEGS